MKSIDWDAPIDKLWELLDQKNFEVNRIICVYRSSEIFGIITDSEIRKYISLHRSLPTAISEITRHDYIYVDHHPDRMKMALIIADQLERREYSTLNSVNEILVVSGNKADLVPITDFSGEISLLRDKFFVVGLGYIGLTLFAVLFARMDSMRVFGIENSQEKIAKLKNRDFYVLEPGLDDYLADLGGSNLFQAVKEVWATRQSGLGKNVYFIAVQTPVSKDGTTSLDALLSATEEISPYLQKGDVVVIRSTVPVGTSRWIAKRIEVLSNLECGIDFHLGFAPERTIEGDAIREIENLPQIISGYSNSCTSKIREIVQRWTTSIMVASSLEIAELTKLSNNAFRDHHFAFANELSMIAGRHSVDINEVIHLANSGYKRGGIPMPSAGVGGPCLSKDSKILLAEKITQATLNKVFLDKSNIGKSTILSARIVNESMPIYLANRIIKDISSEELVDRNGILIGMAFKGFPATNDLRNSPSVELGLELTKNQVNLYCWDAAALELDLRELALRPIHDLIAGDTKPTFCVIGNNHVKNVEKLKALVDQFSSLKKVYDPWDLVRALGEIAFFRSREVIIENLSTRI